MAPWHPLGAPYSVDRDSCKTDQSGHYSISDNARTKYDYTLKVTGSGYFEDEGYLLSVNFSNKVNISLFPHGYIKTHIINKIDTARHIEIFFSPYYASGEIFRFGFINTFIISPAYADTTIITRTIGGVQNRLKIQIYPTDYVPDVKVVIDTSVLTRRHDTLRLDRIILK